MQAPEALTAQQHAARAAVRPAGRQATATAPTVRRAGKPRQVRMAATERVEAATRVEAIMAPHAAVPPARPIRAITEMPAQARLGIRLPKHVRHRLPPEATVQPEQVRKVPARPEPQQRLHRLQQDRRTAHQRPLRTIHRPVRHPVLPIHRLPVVPAVPAAPVQAALVVHAAAVVVAVTAAVAAAVLLAEDAGNQKHRSL